MQSLAADVETGGSRAFGAQARIKRSRIEVQCMKHIGDILEGGDNGATVLRGGLFQCGIRRALAVKQCPTVE